MSNEIELYSKMANPIDAIDKIGEMFAKSGMFGCDRVEQGKILAMICLAEKKSPVAITRDFDIVEGKLRKKALAALADFRGMGGKHKWINSGDAPAANEEDWKASLWLKDRDGIEITYDYSMADARKEGLIKDKSRWVKRPGNMLRARCISNGLGMLCPELYAGDDDNESDAPSPTPLLPERKDSTVTSAPPVSTPAKSERPDNVIDIQATPTHSETTGSQTTATVVAAPSAEAQTTAPTATAPEPKKFTSGDVKVGPDGRLTLETVQAIDALIPVELKVAADKWLKDHKYIINSLEDMNVERARRLIEKTDAFLKHVGGAK